MLPTSNQQKRVYLDNGASTPVDPRVVVAMSPFWTECVGNAGSLHEEGRFAKKVLAESRCSVAHTIRAQPENIVFTSGGTESNNLAVLGVVEKCLDAGKKPEEIHIITSAVEHNSIIDCFRYLETKGVRATYLPVDTEGRVDARALESALTVDTVLVSCMYVNNEIGTIENIKQLSGVVRKYQKESSSDLYPLFHTDASQAPAWIAVDVQKLGVDLLTLDSQKMYGPKGVGCLYVRDRACIDPILYGGGQEFGLRPGTPPVPLIVGFTKALELVEEERETYVNTVRELRDSLVAQVLEKVPEVIVNGPRGEGRVACNSNISFLGIDAEQLVIELDARGIAVSTKSACLSEDSGGSRVVQALRNGNTEHFGAIRISLSRHTSKEEIESCTQILIETVEWLQEKG